MWFRIPEYQRPYVWDIDQVTELLEDISQACSSNQDAQYFLGSMVLKKNIKIEGNITYEEFDLLDGQQRITTLFLLLAVIRDITPITNSGRLKACSDSIYKMASPDDDEPERLRIVFDIRDRVKDFTNEFIKQFGGTTKEEQLNERIANTDEDISIRNMSKAILTIRKYLDDHPDIDSFFKFLRTKVLMIYVATEELQDAFHLFTVMNNRGIKLRNSDILKALNLKEIPIQLERITYAKKWEDIELYFGEDFDNFLSHLRTILVKQKATTNLLKEFEDNIYAPREFDRTSKVYISKQALIKKGKATFDFVNKYFVLYNSLFENDNCGLSGSFELNNYLVLMQKGFEADYWVAALLRYFEKYHNSRLITFVKALDRKFSYDWITSVSPTNRIENINTILKAIDASSTADILLTSNAFNIDIADLKRVIDMNVYGRSFAKYILLKLDLLYHGHTTKFDPPTTISLEHILPQNPSQNSKWQLNFSIVDRQEWTDKLGNLTLISRRKNTAQGNLDYVDKKSRYFKGNVELFSNSVRVYNTYTAWTPTELKSNHAEVIKKFMAEYQ